MKFMPSLDLSRMLYEEEIKEIMEDKFSGLKYAAVTLGMCSEVLGLDDEVSMDHEWGPRVILTVSQKDYGCYAKDITQKLQELLPTQFKGFDMLWRKPGVDVHDTREKVLYHIYVRTVPKLLKSYAGITSLPLEHIEWLKISEQHLLELTSGTVYKDDIGELTKARDYLKHYPDPVLRFLLMHEWLAVGNDYFPIGRIGSRGDTLGLRIQTSNVVNRLMRIAFMISRRYFPYKKWFGTLFKELPIGPTLTPLLLELLNEENWRKVEEHIWKATLILLQHQNQLGIAPEITLDVKKVDDGRHHIKINFWDIGKKTATNLPPSLKSLNKNSVFWLHENNLILGNEEVGKRILFLQK